MSIGAFTGKTSKPTDDEVVSTLGPSYQRWLSLVEYLRGGYKAKEDFAFLYGKGYGWALRFRLKGRLLTALFPNNGYFSVQVNLNRAQLAETEGMQLHKNAVSAIREATFYAEGKWTFTPVQGDADLKDAQKLIRLKSVSIATEARGGRANISLKLTP